ncbi:MAG: ATP-binding protein [Acetobacteraceae bacterium]
MSPRFSEFLPEGTARQSKLGPDVDVADLVEESVAVFGLDMRVAAWNAEAERLYGWKREEVIGGAIQAAVRCSPSEPLHVITAKVHETGTWRGEFTRTTKSGDIVVVKVKWSLRRDANGVPLDIVETSRDITEVRRTEEALERVQHQYQNLFQASVAAFWDLEFSEVRRMVRVLLESGIRDLRAYFRSHPDYVRGMIRATRIVDMNAQSLLMFGNGDRESLLRSLDPLWPEESLGVFAESVAAIFDNKAHYSSEVVLFSLDGRRFDTLFAVSYPPRMLQPARLLIGIVDVTQAKAAKVAQEKSERRYRDFFHFLPVALFHLDRRDLGAIFAEARSQGVEDLVQYLRDHPDLVAPAMDALKVVEVNQRTVTMLHGQSPEDFKGSVAPNWTESPEIFCECLSAAYQGKDSYEAQIRIKARDGTILDTLFFAAFSPVTGEENITLIGLIDVSDRVKAQEMLAQVQAEIAHAARVSVLGELTASIAHEVSQPLTAIETNTEASLLWLARSPPNIDEVRELSARTAAEVQRAADIIHRIRSMVVRTSPEQKNIALNPMIDEAVLFLRHELQRNDVETSLQLGPDLPTLFGDRVQLQQVIVNLAVNAIQAMALANSVVRELTIRTVATADRCVLIEVEDTGPGIAEDALGRLFESFFTTKATGMGIGLPICRSIIEAHGGQISVANRDDRPGARFAILLPTRSSVPLPLSSDSA